MRLVESVLFAALVCGAPFHTLGAQSAQKYSIQASVLGEQFGGDAFTSGTPFGVGGEVQFRYTTRSGWSYGLGYQATEHNTSAGQYSGPFFEPRFTFVLRDNESLFPYLSGRFADLIVGNLYTYNAGGGVLVRLTQKVNLDVGATFGGAKYELFGGTGAAGTNLIVRTGLSFGLR